MQLGQLNRIERQEQRSADLPPSDKDLELLSERNGERRSRVTDEETEHLKAIGVIKKALVRFDLSRNEVRVYLFLARFGAQKAQRIAEALGVHRTEAYKILHRLERQGLISCVFERPMKFVAIPFDKALENLIEERRHRIHLMERRKKQLVDIWLSLPKPAEVKTKSETFQVLEGRRQISVKAGEFLEACGRELLMILSDKHLLWLFNSPFFEDLAKILKKRQLDVRIMANYSPTSTYVFEQLDMDNLDFAYHDSAEAPNIIVSDGCRMVLLMDNGQEGDDKPYALSTNYESIVSSFSLLFKLLWEREPAGVGIRMAGAAPTV